MLKVGDKVRLVTGSVEMAVNTCDQLPDQTVYCVWFDGVKRFEEMFAAKCLTDITYSNILIRFKGLTENPYSLGSLFRYKKLLDDVDAWFQAVYPDRMNIRAMWQNMPMSTVDGDIGKYHNLYVSNRLDFISKVVSC